jgi:nucleoside-diphosphate-sugar epimerase
MIRPSSKHDSRVLITGGTGFIGHYLLAGLLRRQVRCAVLLRPALDQSTRRLREMLGDLGVDLDEMCSIGRVVLMPGDVVRGLPDPVDLNIRSIIHCAASTRFQNDPSGEPRKTNVTGTLTLLRWAHAHGINDLHLVSSAYQCGKTNKPARETLSKNQPRFHNPYERTKWQAERACATWSHAGPGRTLTIYRPSIVVGEYRTGRATKFSGFYLMARASRLLAEQYDNGPGRDDRHHIPLRLRGRAEDCQNIVPVDHVSAMIVHAFLNRQFHGGTFHLTNPGAPSNKTIQRAIESHYDIAGGRFVNPDTFDPGVMTEMERLFIEVSRPIEHYFIDTPDFERASAQQLQSSAGLSCPTYRTDDLCRLFTYADQSQRVRPRGSTAADTKAVLPPSTDLHNDTALYDTYFKSFLPDRVNRSKIAKATGFTVTMRFVIEDIPDGQWACRFEHGRLVEVHRGENTFVEDFCYRTHADVFWRSISGDVHPQQVFLKRQARVTGNVEQALKMAMILHKFNQEFPCDRETLLREGVRV